VYFARGFAALIVIGNVSFPIAVMTGIVDHDDGERRVVCEETQQVDSSEPCADVEVGA
jgi:hypothetical protein